MTVQQAATNLLNQYSPDTILKALEIMKKDAVSAASYIRR